MEFEVEVEVPQYPQHHAGLLFYKIHFFFVLFWRWICGMGRHVNE